MLVTVEIPENVARCFGNSAEVVGRSVLEFSALEGYRSGRLSHADVQAMLAFESWAETERFLRTGGVPVDYTEADLQADRASLDGFIKSK